jgi:hypothetical protein
VFFTRALQFGSGLSPIVPLMIGGAGCSRGAPRTCGGWRSWAEVSSFEAWAAGTAKDDVRSAVHQAAHRPRTRRRRRAGRGWRDWLRQAPDARRHYLDAGPPPAPRLSRPAQ